MKFFDLRDTFLDLEVTLLNALSRLAFNVAPLECWETIVKALKIQTSTLAKFGLTFYNFWNQLRAYYFWYFYH